MRELKFRQPIYENGKFVKWHYWGFNGSYQFTINQNESQEFIGKTDKNNKEIFEGDFVILHDTDTKDKAEVIFEDGCFGCYTSFGTFWQPSRKSEVIRNKFENPELIK